MYLADVTFCDQNLKKMKMFTVTFKFFDGKQFIAAILFTCILKSVNSQQCSKLTFDKKHTGQRLVGFNIVTLIEESIGTCVKTCFQLTHCLSTNFDTVSKQCDLNNITADDMPTAVVKSDTSILSDLSAWPKAMVGSCGDKPCNGRDICLPAGNLFLCRNSDCPNAPLVGNAMSTGSIEIGGKMVYNCTQPFSRILGQDYVHCGWMNTWSSNIEITCIAEPKDCLDVKDKNISQASGAHNVRSPYTGIVSSVYCDMTTDGGGWTEMTSHNITELRIDLTAADGTTAYQTYQNFSLSPGPDYTLHIGQAAGTADDSSHGLKYSNGYRFSTKDRDVDAATDVDCAEWFHGAWWYGLCTAVNLNGEYITPGTTHDIEYAGVFYYSFQQVKSLKTTRMMFRRN